MYISIKVALGFRFRKTFDAVIDVIIVYELLSVIYMTRIICHGGKKGTAVIVYYRLLLVFRITRVIY